MDWDDLRYFLAVARGGSLTEAAGRLRASPSTIARRIAGLEETLGLRLFTRHQTGYALTDEGERLLAKADAVEDSVLDLRNEMAGRDAAPRGRVRLATTENHANYIIIPHLPEFRAAYPGITIELVTGARMVSLTKREADMALRVDRPSQGNLTARKLGEFAFTLYGAPGYDGEDHIAWDDSFADLDIAQWLARHFPGREPALVTTSLAGQLVAARAGLGLALLPCFMGDPDPGLVRRLPPGQGMSHDLWLVVHSDLRHAARIRAVTDFLAGLVNGCDGLLRGTEDIIP